MARVRFRRYTLSAFLWLALLSLSACGFHLRGAVEYPPAMKETYIDGNANSAVVRDLRLNLEASGAHVVESPQAAGASVAYAERAIRSAGVVGQQPGAGERV